MERPLVSPICAAAALCAASAHLSAPVFAQEIILDVDKEAEEAQPALLLVPYAFYAATYEFALAFGAVATGQIQDQMSLFFNTVGSTNGTTELQLGMWGAKIPGTDRLFADGWVSLGNYTQLRAYVGQDENGVPAGSNDSDADNFIEDSAVELWSEWNLEWVLPIGPGDAEPIQTYRLRRGLLEGSGTGGEVWNPLTSGRTSVGLSPFYRRQEFDAAPGRRALSTNGLALSLEYDNRDFPRNPSYGSRQFVRWSQDFGALDSTTSWTVIEAEAAKYVDLGATDWARQQVLALGAWTADSPSWSDDDGDGQPENAPPYFRGATLGGRRRLRAFPTNRFNDRAAVHYWAEYRMIPGWQPLPSVEELSAARIDWWQLAAFVEVGRVAPAWSFDQLHEDMKWDAGLSLRIFARKAIVRLDFAVGPEQSAVWLDLGHPF